MAEVDHKASVRKWFLISFKEGVTEAQKEEVVNDYVKLVDTDPYMLDVEWGTDLRRQNFHHGYTHAFLNTFASLEDDDAFVAASGHINFSKKYTPILEKFLVIDYYPSYYSKKKLDGDKDQINHSSKPETSI